MKTKTDIFTIIIAIVFLAATGYFAYDKFLAPYEGNSVPNVNIEPATINEYYVANGVMDEVPGLAGEILDNMENSEASYFKISHEGEFYQLQQIPKGNFATLEAEASIKECCDKTLDMSRDCLMNFFSFTYEKIKEPDTRIGYKSYVVEKSFDTAAINVEKKLQSYFNGNIDKFYLNKELVLSCNDVQFTKVGKLKSEHQYEQFDQYFVLGSAKVTTVSAEKDLSKAWILPAKNNTKDIKIKAVISLHESSLPLMYILDFNYIEFE